MAIDDLIGGRIALEGIRGGLDRVVKDIFWQTKDFDMTVGSRSVEAFDQREVVLGLPYARADVDFID